MIYKKKKEYETQENEGADDNIQKRRKAACLPEKYYTGILVVLYSFALTGMILLAHGFKEKRVEKNLVVPVSAMKIHMDYSGMQVSNKIKEQVENAVGNVAGDKVEGEIEKDVNEKKIATLTMARREREKEWEAERIRREKKRKEKKRLDKIEKQCGVRVTRTEQAVLERIVEAEAGDQDLEGRILIANVVLNRVKKKGYPNTIEGVVFQCSQGRYQFSPIYDGRYWSVDISEKTKKAVKKAMEGVDYSDGAMYFMSRAYADSSGAAWFDNSLTWLFVHGCHEFYK